VIIIVYLAMPSSKQKVIILTIRKDEVVIHKWHQNLKALRTEYCIGTCSSTPDRYNVLKFSEVNQQG